MPLLTPGDSHVHHHSLLAGVGAGTAAVLVCGALILGVWRRISPQVGAAATVIVWAVVAAVIAAAAYVVVRLALLTRHHLAHPETLTRHTIRAGVIPATALPADDTPALPAAELPAIEPPRPETRTHYHFDSQEAVEAALQAMQERQASEEDRP